MGLAGILTACVYWISKNEGHMIRDILFGLSSLISPGLGNFLIPSEGDRAQRMDNYHALTGHKTTGRLITGDGRTIAFELRNSGSNEIVYLGDPMSVPSLNNFLNAVELGQTGLILNEVGPLPLTALLAHLNLVDFSE